MEETAVTYHFLCQRSRRWLLARPGRARSWWESGMFSAQALVARGDWYQALPHAGLAFEAAQLMVGDARRCNRDWVTRREASRCLLRLLGQRLTCDGAQRAEAVLH